MYHVSLLVVSVALLISLYSFFFFFNDTATTEIYTLSLHDALPIFFLGWGALPGAVVGMVVSVASTMVLARLDRKSTRLNSSHGYISYAVFCLKKKKKSQKCIGYEALEAGVVDVMNDHKCRQYRYCD